ncbi:MAG: cytochrome c3 family protein [Rhodocyclaceae bacterium]|nr:cytochrome c3 family protein [Rhodocyclaceae bacterium]
MPHKLPTLLRLAVALACVAVSAAAHPQDLRGTKHNLSGRVDLQANEAGQICVFCHTPRLTLGAPADQPLWQSNLGSGFSFSIFDDIGRMGTAGNTAVGSQSIACLSCHDSAQAFSINRQIYDHPFGVPYRGAGSQEIRKQAVAAARASGAPMHEARVIVASEFRPAQRALIDNRPVWWASQEANKERRGRSDLPLFVRLDRNDGSEIPFIECASCHNPHSSEALFLRVSPANGILCQTCHVK